MTAGNALTSVNGHETPPQSMSVRDHELNRD